jgi:exonuclease III
MISILSFNIYNQTKNKEDLLIKKLNNTGVNKCNELGELPELILTQEHIKCFLDSPDSVYKEFYSFGSGCEKIGLFINNRQITNANEKIKILYRIETTNDTVSGISYKDLFPMYRYGLIIKYKDITIGNLHLEGGRFSDRQLLVNKYKLISFKLQLLKEIIQKRPDIICGDFNSIHLDSNEKFTTKQASELLKNMHYMCNQIYHRKITIDELKFIIDMNYLPYKLLKKAGYVYAKPDNYISSITSSRGGSIVDTIWYLPDRVRCTKSSIINCGEVDNNYLFGGLSDHNPIYGTFELI